MSGDGRVTIAVTGVVLTSVQVAVLSHIVESVVVVCLKIILTSVSYRYNCRDSERLGLVNKNDK